MRLEPDASHSCRYARTTYVPFADTKHPLYSYNDFTDQQGARMMEVDVIPVGGRI
jgi:hypothetical protein